MEKYLVEKMKLVLNLKRNIVGVKFLFIPEEYEDCAYDEVKTKCTLCAVTAQAMSGKLVKARYENFTCPGGPELLGMTPVSSFVRSGKRFSNFRLYEDLAISRQVQNDLCFLEQKIYGVAAGPMEEMEEADVVLFLSDAWQMMRVIQGYTYHHGMAKNIGMIGNQGICSDLVARPFYMNDLNVSVLCAGARTQTKADDSELGAGMPIHIFRDVANGILATLNAATNEKKKKELQQRIEESGDTDLEIEFGKMYSSYSKKSKYSIEQYSKELW